ncbi:GntR family transcriptional regulator [Methylobacterium fujisawaense]|uniref:GntR family transcriptional regulator n=1 Tax=Methylobacterium fujisawaense TaxID=107400 RepID=UPI002446F08C|nr:GntR family transcriptional regulator [Methylobacterium fujisawaense]MDH3031060.1 GntR family transcriptional regulator [Methylobacterium fujisawaense]
MVVFEEMRAAVEAAAPDKLALVMSAVAQAYSAGGLTDDQYEQLDGLLASRRRVAQAAPVRIQTLGAACPQLAPATAPASERQGTAPARPHHRTGSRPRTPASMGRRRHWAAAGFLPPKLAAGFTLGEQAVLAVVGKHIAARGTCALAVGAIAALAGVSDPTVRRALRQAALVGLLTIEQRRITGFRNDTNMLRIASAEWASWLRLRLPRSVRADLRSGYQSVTGTNIGRDLSTVSGLLKAGYGPPAHAGRTTLPAARVAGA